MLIRWALSLVYVKQQYVIDICMSSLIAVVSGCNIGAKVLSLILELKFLERNIFNDKSILNNVTYRYKTIKVLKKLNSSLKYYSGFLLALQ